MDAYEAAEQRERRAKEEAAKEASAHGGSEGFKAPPEPLKRVERGEGVDRRGQ